MRAAPSVSVLLLVAALAVNACGVRGVPADLATVPPPAIELPQREDSLRFAVIGDTGTGGLAQYRLAARLIAAHTRFPFEFVLMNGDNMYGSEGDLDFETKFAVPYKALLDAGVKFYASLGNHDDPNQIYYKPFNMDGQRFYSFKPKDGVRIFALDSTYMSPEQLQWLEKELAASQSDWKLVFFHHPIYSEGRHGSDIKLRQAVEPLFVAHGVDVVFAGHEHFYERLKPQQGIHYFTVGASAKLRPGDIDRGSPLHLAGFDEGYSFMLMELNGHDLHFQVITEEGRTVDRGLIRRAAETTNQAD
jgi:hypothetical protein